MSQGRIGPGSSDRAGALARREEEDRQAFEEARAAASSPLKESFVASIIAARQPPRLPLDDIVPDLRSGSGALFSAQLEALAERSPDEIGPGLAGIFVAHAEDAKVSGDPEVAAAFEYLGELMLNYEHLRLLRTGELG